MPEEIGNLSNLEELNINSQRSFTDVTDYKFTGSLPNTMNNLTSLKNFNASYNRISGDLDVSSLTNLHTLNLLDNRLSGLKLGVINSFTNGGRLSVNLTQNPFISCIEVPTAENYELGELYWY